MSNYHRNRLGNLSAFLVIFSILLFFGPVFDILHLGKLFENPFFFGVTMAVVAFIAGALTLCLIELLYAKKNHHNEN